MNTIAQNRTNAVRFEECGPTFSWKSILAGVTVAITIGLLVNLLGVGLGFSAFTFDKEALENLSMTTIAWLAGGNLVAMFIAGWVTTSMAGLRCNSKGFWHGFVMAAISTFILLAAATTTVGGIVGGTFNILGGITSSKSPINITQKQDSGSLISSLQSLSSISADEAADKVKDALPDSFKPMVDQVSEELNEFVDSIHDKIQDQMPSSTDVKEKTEQVKEKALQIKKKLLPAIYRFMDSINTPQYDAERKNLINKLAEVSGKSNSDIEQMIDTWQKNFEEAKAKAVEAIKQAADKTAAFIAKFALINFFAIVAGVFMAGIGGIVGVRKVRRYDE